MKGFTLIEILLVIALVLVMGFLATAFSGRFIAQMAVRDAAGEFSSILHKAQSFSVSGRDHSAWGVRYDDSTIYLFKGDSYAGRDMSFSETTKIDEHIVVSGFSEVTFTRPEGRPDQEISDLRLEWDNLADAQISVNAEGAIQ